MRWDFGELISRDAIGKAPMRSENCELILKDASRLLCTREYVGRRLSLLGMHGWKIPIVLPLITTKN